ncbi:MAG: phosphotransferase [Halieaceae bacterium]
MVETLPHASRLRLDQALAQWRQWRNGPTSPPEVVELLGAGISNTSLRVNAGGSDWVLRIDGIDPQKLGLSRSTEWRALSHAARQGLSPAPSYQNPELGVLVCEFIQEQAADADSGLADIAQLLRAIHDLPPLKFRLDPMSRATHYLQLAGDEELPRQFLQACERLQQDAPDPVLCHNDLLRANRLRGADRLLALDWEYAAMGDACFDLAVIMEGDSLDQDACRALHHHYLQREANATEQQRLQDNRLVYRELSRLWECIYSEQNQQRK